jgi:hypothetical protein
MLSIGLNLLFGLVSIYLSYLCLLNVVYRKTLWSTIIDLCENSFANMPQVSPNCMHAIWSHLLCSIRKRLTLIDGCSWVYLHLTTRMLMVNWNKEDEWLQPKMSFGSITHTHTHTHTHPRHIISTIQARATHCISLITQYSEEMAEAMLCSSTCVERYTMSNCNLNRQM